MSSAAFKQLVTAAIERDKELKGVLSDGIAAIIEAMAKDDRFAGFIANPSVSLDIKERELASVVPHVVEQARHTVLMLIRDGQLGKLDGFFARVLAARYAREGKVAAIVESAVPLTQAQQTEVANTLKKHYAQEPVLTLRIKPDLIGGVRITVGDTQFDSTISGRLDRLRERIAHAD